MGRMEEEEGEEDEDEDEEECNVVRKKGRARVGSKGEEKQ